MKRLYFLFIACLFLCQNNQLKAQNTWAPEGAVWHYSYHSGWGQYTSYMTMSSIGDTLIQGKNCSVLNLVGPGDSLPDYNETYYTYEQNDTVWLFDGTHFRVLYNFNVNPNDTFESYGHRLFPMCYDSTTTVIVDSVNYETVNGVLLKYMIVRTPEQSWGFSSCYNGTESFKIYQKIGCLSYMFPHEICATDLGGVCDLRCYEDAIFGFWTSGQYDSCTYEDGVGVNEIDQNRIIKVYPNPISDYVSIDMVENFITAQLEIYSFDGRILKTIKLEAGHTVLNLSDLKSGCYFLKFDIDHKFFQSRIIKL